MPISSTIDPSLFGFVNTLTTFRPTSPRENISLKINEIQEEEGNLLNHSTLSDNKDIQGSENSLGENRNNATFVSDSQIEFYKLRRLSRKEDGSSSKERSKSKDVDLRIKDVRAKVPSEKELKQAKTELASADFKVIHEAESSQTKSAIKPFLSKANNESIEQLEHTRKICEAYSSPDEDIESIYSPNSIANLQTPPLFHAEVSITDGGLQNYSKFSSKVKLFGESRKDQKNYATTESSPPKYLNSSSSTKLREKKSSPSALLSQSSRQNKISEASLISMKLSSRNENLSPRIISPRLGNSPTANKRIPEHLNKATLFSKKSAEEVVNLRDVSQIERVRLASSSVNEDDQSKIYQSKNSRHRVIEKEKPERSSPSVIATKNESRAMSKKPNFIHSSKSVDVVDAMIQQSSPKPTGQMRKPALRQKDAVSPKKFATMPEEYKIAKRVPRTFHSKSNERKTSMNDRSLRAGSGYIEIQEKSSSPKPSKTQNDRRYRSPGRVEAIPDLWDSRYKKDSPKLDSTPNPITSKNNNLKSNLAEIGAQPPQQIVPLSPSSIIKKRLSAQMDKNLTPAEFNYSPLFGK